mmetsp:Transcript_12709/g.25908  ORF Transcript_12709/g.25908 Transcript_12709/m.25908 type:complete len:288 (-) Transcript_12709:522-1385(-)
MNLEKYVWPPTLLGALGLVLGWTIATSRWLLLLLLSLSLSSWLLRFRKIQPILGSLPEHDDCGAAAVESGTHRCAIEAVAVIKGFVHVVVVVIVAIPGRNKYQKQSGVGVPIPGNVVVFVIDVFGCSLPVVVFVFVFVFTTILFLFAASVACFVPVLGVDVKMLQVVRGTKNFVDGFIRLSVLITQQWRRVLAVAIAIAAITIARSITRIVADTVGNSSIQCRNKGLGDGGHGVPQTLHGLHDLIAAGFFQALWERQGMIHADRGRCDAGSKGRPSEQRQFVGLVQI